MSAKKQAYAYLRVSGKTQIEGTGLDRQHDIIAAYAKSNNIEIVAEYRDEGISGTKGIADRPGLASLLAELKVDGVKLVLVESPDRLARDLMISEIALAEFREAGATVIECDGGNDLTVGDNDPTRVMVRQILGSIAQFRKTVTVEKLKAARQKKRHTVPGWTEGKKPFGFRPGEQQTVDRMLHLRRCLHDDKAWSFKRIADTLNKEGCPTRGGKPWHPAAVLRIIKQQRANRRSASKG